MTKSQDFHIIPKTSASGQSLFEVVFAVGIVSLILITIVSLATVSIRNSTNSRISNQAVRSIEEATEWIRGERDTTDWVAFSTKAPGTYCLSNLNWIKPQACLSTDFMTGTTILRSVVLTVIDTVTIQADVKADWTDSQGAHQTVSSTYFTKWR